MIIDSHVHIGRDRFAEMNNILTVRGSQHKQNIEELIKKMDFLGIDKAFIFPFPYPSAYFNKDEVWYYKENEFLKNYFEIYKKRLYFIPATNPKDKKSLNYVKSLIEEYELKGLKIHTRATQYDFKYMDKSFLNFIRKKEIPIIFHICSGKEQELKRKNIDATLKSGIKFAKKNRECRFVFTHLGRLHKDIEKISKLENVALDTSALSVKNKYEEFLAEKYHNVLIKKTPYEIIPYLVDIGLENRIIWGSDEPYGISYEKELEYIKNNPLIDGTLKKKFLEKNVKEWFDLK